MPLGETLTNSWDHIQGFLFPMLRAEVGPLGEKHEELVRVLELARPETFVVVAWHGLPGRPANDRRALARAFTAKSVFGLPTTAALIERLAVDQALRRICGWERARKVPGASIFSRAFKEFVNADLPTRAHASLIERTHKDRLVGHISRDATAIEAREKPVKIKVETPAEPTPPKRKRGRPRKGEVVTKPEPRRLERQAGMTLTQMLADLPKHCNVGTKRNAKGYKTSWIGYKLHIDTADGDLPITCLLTSASVHDSQVAIPLATMTATRLINLYDLMDTAYDASEIWAKSRALGHVPIIDRHPRGVEGGKAEIAAEAKRLGRIDHRLAEDVRYDQRSSAERVNSALKDTYGGRYVRVRGHAKVFCHLMFGVLALTVAQLYRLIV